ncbi:MAG: hypothetical protein COV31_00220 [Candidatus Yanofskybacteria bacterium CG10_big_fil_rev_8_21_14_0_10_46_23]|uniref:Glycosyl transferase family 1 domain-containing protein n=1 Tax=Candidatus Yanofskybacteria bacterium CG10_big_fil_rev_8_21_14_0_10_46_23 TaxID=1975098 RepID=A0A2H0R598_9BACT|nr:MAG: hypothetical protein COV31_00220 [Candidatus Yanofskybacteria bacterium CG10_big_fil_rev_8_21_14_0_10_46_23]
MKNLLIITQKVDVEDDLLGFFVGWIEEFSNHFDQVFVISLAVGSFNFPKNVTVYSLGKEKGASKILQFFRLVRFLFGVMPKVQGVFAHMSPIFAIAAWPATFLFRKKLILWYLHRQVSRSLKLAQKFSKFIVTADRDSLNLKSSKIIETGHGIDFEKFGRERSWSDSHLRMLSVGRISPIKNFETLIRAVEILRNEGLNFSLDIVGRPIAGKDFSYYESLKKLVVDRGLDKSVNFIGFVPHTRIAPYFERTDFCVGPLPTGGIDKAMLEGMAAGCVVLTSNQAFEKYFGPYGDKLLFEFNNDQDLARKIKLIYAESSAEKREISEFLVQSVKKSHNLKNTINQIVNLYER